MSSSSKDHLIESGSRSLLGWAPVSRQATGMVYAGPEPEVGILAQRAKDRPNRIGLCTCELVGVQGASIVVRGLDAIDGTPVLDVKPAMTEFAPRGDMRQPAWSHELMRGYW